MDGRRPQRGQHVHGDPRRGQQRGHAHDGNHDGAYAHDDPRPPALPPPRPLVPAPLPPHGLTGLPQVRTAADIQARLNAVRRQRQQMGSSVSGGNSSGTGNIYGVTGNMNGGAAALVSSRSEPRLGSGERPTVQRRQPASWEVQQRPIGQTTALPVTTGTRPPPPPTSRPAPRPRMLQSSLSESSISRTSREESMRERNYEHRQPPYQDSSSRKLVSAASLEPAASYPPPPSNNATARRPPRPAQPRPFDPRDDGETFYTRLGGDSDSPNASYGELTQREASYGELTQREASHGELTQREASLSASSQQLSRLAIPAAAALAPTAASSSTSLQSSRNRNAEKQSAVTDDTKVKPSKAAMESAQFFRIDENYRAMLVHSLLKLNESQPPPTREDFLSEEGYYSWTDRAENQGDDPRFCPLVARMLQLWDLDHPLLSEDHIKKSTLSNSAPAQFTPPAFATTVNLVLRIIEARGLPLDSKGRGRNCVVVVEYNPTTGSAASKGKSSAAVNDSEKLRFETNVEMNTVTPMWNQQITLTVHNLSDPVTVVLFHRKEKSGLFGEEVKDEFLGCTKLRVQELVTGAVKNGFVDEWLPLNNTDYKDKYRKQSVSGELHIEVEMGGIISDTDGTGPSASADLAIPMELQQLKDLEHRLITYKVNLKSIYSLLLEAVVLLDLCVASGKDLSKIRVKDQAWFLSREGVLILRQFSQVWTISDVFRKMKYLECVFRKYKEQRLHARVVTAAYKNLYEGIWKRGSIWLPNYEQPLLFQNLAAIERYLTDQLRKFKDYFPPPQPLTNVGVDYITTSIDCIVLLTRMIDKNPFFLAEVENKDSSESDVDVDADTSGAVGISDYDYRNGQFSFTEKLKGILQSRVVVRYQQLSELASPPSGADTLETTLVKCRDLARMMLDDVEEDRNVYRKAFAKEQIDILPISVDTFLQYFALENENLANFYETARRKGQSVVDADAAANPDLPQTEEEVLTVAFELMENVHEMKRRWTKYAKTMPIDIGAWFSPYIHRWLALTEAKTLEWVKSAIDLDTFEPVPRNGANDTGNNSDLGCSSSVQDLFAAIFQALVYLQKTVANWPSPVQHAKFLTRFGQIAARAVSQYCRALQDKEEEVQRAIVRPVIPIPEDTASTSNAVKAAAAAAMKWFNARGGGEDPAAGQPMADDEPLIEIVDFASSTCVRLHNVEAFNKRLAALYRDMDCGAMQKVTDEWRQMKRESGRSTSAGVTGSLKLQVILVEGLKVRSGLIAGRSNPYAVVKSQATELHRTHVVEGTLNPLFVDWNPAIDAIVASLNRPRRKVFPFVFDSVSSVGVVRDCQSLEISVYHKSDPSALSQYITGASVDTLMAQGSLLLSAVELARGDDVLRWVDLAPQGRALVQVQLVASGLSNVVAKSSSSDDTTADFGNGGVEDVDFWFTQMEACLNTTRQALVQPIVDLTTAHIEPLLTRALLRASKSGSPTVPMSVTEADALLATVMDVFNHIFSNISSSLSDIMAQHVIYRIWLRAVLRTLAHQLAPIEYHAESAAAPVLATLTSVAASSIGLNNVLQRALDVRQLSAIGHWLPMVTEFFHADGVGLGLPRAILEQGSRQYDEVRTLLECYQMSAADLCATARSRCTSVDGAWVLLRLIWGRLLWMGGSGPHADLLKTTWKELMSRRYELLRRNFAVL